MSEKMTLERFEELVAAYGADTENWPRDQRAAMVQLLEEQFDAAAILARGARLDAALNARLPDADSDLEARILRTMNTALGNDIISFPQAQVISSRFIWSATTALAACFVGGIIVGPVLVEAFFGGSDLTVSFDIVSDVFLPTEPL